VESVVLRSVESVALLLLLQQVCQWLNWSKSPAEFLNFRTIEPVLHPSRLVEEVNSIGTATTPIVTASNQ